MKKKNEKMNLSNFQLKGVNVRLLDTQDRNRSREMPIKTPEDACRVVRELLRQM